MFSTLVLAGCNTKFHERRPAVGECVDCHQSDYDQTKVPPHTELFATTCDDCHDELSWEPSLGFDHSWFERQGAHQEATCDGCHAQGYAQGVTPTTCFGCHEDDQKAATEPAHDDFPRECDQCHSNQAFKPALTGTHPEDIFPITADHHSEFGCVDCHDPGLGLPLDKWNTNCVGCHEGSHEQAKMATVHEQVSDYAFVPENPRYCLSCHPSGYANRHPESLFPVTVGKHQELACDECHDATLGPNAGGGNTNCIGCHNGDHEQDKMDDVHQRVGDYAFIPQTPNFCRGCHPSGVAARHPEQRFTIASGDHAELACTDCHDAALGLPDDLWNTNCVGCHTGDHEQAKMDEVHSIVGDYRFQAENPRFCLGCHPSGVSDTDSHPLDRFPLAAGQHGDLQCAECHDPTLGSPLAGLNTDCIGCHTGEHDLAQMDSLHAIVGGYVSQPQNPRFCLSCHPAGTSQTDLHPEARFPIEANQHQPFECTDCHDAALGSPIAGLNTNCVGCHTGDHDRARMESTHQLVADYAFVADDPNFCLGCHPAGQAATHPEAAFPIARDNHAGTGCAECHKSSLGSPVQGQNTDCVGCHRGSHERALMAETHSIVGGYDFIDGQPNFCLGCHPSGISQADGHPNSAFPIAAGAHTGQQCADCHDPGLGSPLDGLNTNCVGCHTGEHSRAAMDQAHEIVAGYEFRPGNPNFCLSCHPSGEAERHPDDRFPISSGNHTGFACDDCHDPALGSNARGLNTDCIGCHTGDHAQGAMDSRHSGVSGYAFAPDNPRFCLSCHPSGVAASHPDNAFRISTGDHSAFTCDDCHDASRGPNSGGLNANCTGCHTGEHARSPMESRHNLVGDFRWSDANVQFCLTCHPGGTAEVHPRNRFSLSGAHRQRCLDCHDPGISPDASRNANCIGCHEHRIDRMDSKHREVRNYVSQPGNPDFCLECHPGGRN
ncbi:hypothetical protein [Haliangium sp.]|uniref:hypothetical protein n=1 Tax=Haliangium sp. TaxID=2663208 RepID=UPI003D0A61C1